MREPPPDVALVPLAHCLECGAKFNAIGTGDPKEPARPEPGSILVCIKCGAVSILGDDLAPRGFTEEEVEQLLADRETMNHLADMVENIHLARAVVRHQAG